MDETEVLRRELSELVMHGRRDVLKPGEVTISMVQDDIEKETGKRPSDETVRKTLAGEVRAGRLVIDKRKIGKAVNSVYRRPDTA